jgi:hypothetical protein
LYEVTFSGSADDTNNTRSTTAWFLEDSSSGSFAEVDGSKCFTYQRTTADGENSCSRTVILNLTNGDSVRLRMDVLDNNAGVQTLADGSSITIKKFIESGADYAEVYYTNDDKLEAGDLVTFDKEISAGIKKAEMGDTIIGVVSTNPGKTIGAGKDWESGRPVPVALKGRVPVKVHLNEGEKIETGDKITISNIAGFGQKAENAGYIIGTALGNADKEGDNLVMVFIDSQWFPGDIKTLANNNRNQLDSNIQNLTNLTSQISDEIVDHEERITKLESIIFSEQENILSINEIQSSKTVKLPEVLNAFANSLTMLEKEGKQVKFSLEGVLEVIELQANKITIQNTEKNKTVGSVVIEAGQKTAIIKTKNIDKTSHIILTPHNPITVGIGEIKEKESFEIQINNTLDKDLKVEWFIIQEK